jgi:hypothetical protein
MAIARCNDCGQPDGRGGNTYSNIPHHPMNDPNSGVICGKEDCGNPPLIWQLEQEEVEYRQGQRVFRLTGGNRMVKLRVQ